MLPTIKSFAAFFLVPMKDTFILDRLIIWYSSLCLTLDCDSAFCWKILCTIEIYCPGWKVGDKGEGVLFLVFFNIALEKVVWLLSSRHINLVYTSLLDKQVIWLSQGACYVSKTQSLGENSKKNKAKIMDNEKVMAKCFWQFMAEVNNFS